MTGETEDRTDPEGTAPVVKGSLDGWGTTSAAPAWIPAQGEPAPTAGPVATGPNPYAAIPAGDAAKTAGGGKRPSSLRAGETEPPAPRRPVPPVPASPPPFEHAANSSDAPGPDAEPSGPSLGERATAFSQQFSALAGERPEIAVGIAFVGGLVLATIFKRFGRR